MKRKNNALRLALTIVAAQALALSLMLGAAAVVMEAEPVLAAQPKIAAPVSGQCRASRDVLDLLLF